MTTHLTALRFDALPLHPSLLSGLADAGYQYCTAIQAETLPFLLSGQDVAGQAQTGTGKTCAFLLATFHHLLAQKIDKPDNRHPKALILAPTRELAIQIAKEAILLNSEAGLRIAIAHGGKDYEKQQRNIEKGVDILIGTPGRLLDYHKKRVFSLRYIQAVVLDEADRMFDLGFIKDVRYFLRRIPKPSQRLGMLFSATLSYKVSELAYEHMNNPKKIQISPEKISSERIAEQVYYPANNEKVSLLLTIIAHTSPKRSIVFVNTKERAEKVWGYLEGNGYPAGLLSGNVAQRKREQLLKGFQQGQYHFLVATDVAARGLHIPHVSHVFNYDLPQDCEDYVHRIGRTARAGESGIALSFACEEYVFSLPEIEEYIGHKLPVIDVNRDAFVAVKPAVKMKTKHSPRKRTVSSRNRGSAK